MKLLAYGLVFLVISSSGWASEPKDLSANLEAFLKNSQTPGIAAAVIVDGNIAAVGAAGIRKQGAPDKVQLHDKFHLGSNTKSMTATLAAILVQDGIIRWDTTIGEIFSDLEVHPKYQSVQLHQLLTNTGGAPFQPGEKLWNAAWSAKGTPTEQRLFMVKGILKKAPAYEPGKKYLYSNVGFSIAGTMLERAAKQPYENLLTERLFKPLGITTAGFRAPATNRKVDQPWGHANQNGKPVPVDPEPGGDNPNAIAPAGAVHMSMLDHAKYAQLFLGTQGEDLLTNENRARLITATALQPYAMGWATVNNPEDVSFALNHNGSNTMFYSTIWVFPNRKSAVVIASNFMGRDTPKGFDQLALQLLTQHAQK